jgi:hypothetical protein
MFHILPDDTGSSAVWVRHIIFPVHTHNCNTCHIYLFSFVIREVNPLEYLSWYVYLLYIMRFYDCRWIKTLTQTSSTALTYSTWHNETAGGRRKLTRNPSGNLGGGNRFTL